MLNHICHVWLFAILWTVTGQAPQFMGFSRPEYWSVAKPYHRVSFPTQGLNTCLLHLLNWHTDSLPLSHQGSHANDHLDVIGNTGLNSKMTHCHQVEVIGKGPVFSRKLCVCVLNYSVRSDSFFSVHGILQGRILGWVATPSSRRSSRLRDQTRISGASCIGRQILYH